jgi:hypothetical protein
LIFFINCNTKFITHPYHLSNLIYPTIIYCLIYYTPVFILQIIQNYFSIHYILFSIFTILVPIPKKFIIFIYLFSQYLNLILSFYFLFISTQLRYPILFLFYIFHVLICIRHFYYINYKVVDLVMCIIYQHKYVLLFLD